MEKTIKKILAVGAHPDDVEIGCGGTIAKHLELGHEVYVIILTSGEKGAHPFTREECLTSLRLMGIKDSNIIFGNFRDGYLGDDIEVVDFLEKHIRKFNIDKVYTHSPKDRHQDHRNCSLATAAAARNIAEILFFESVSTHVNFEPHYYIELNEEHLRKKLSSLNCYKTQIEKGILNLRWIDAMSRVNINKCQAEICEAFEINHILKKDSEI